MSQEQKVRVGSGYEFTNNNEWFEVSQQEGFAEVIAKWLVAGKLPQGMQILAVDEDVVKMEGGARQALDQLVAKCEAEGQALPLPAVVWQRVKEEEELWQTKNRASAVNVSMAADIVSAPGFVKYVGMRTVVHLRERSGTSQSRSWLNTWKTLRERLKS